MELNDIFNLVYYDFLEKKTVDKHFILTIWITNKDGKYILTNNEYPDYRASNYQFTCIVKLKDCLLDYHILKFGTMNKCVLIFSIVSILSQNNKLGNLLNNVKDISIMVDTSELYCTSTDMNLFNFCEFEDKDIQFHENRIIICKKAFNLYQTDFIDNEYLLHFFTIDEKNKCIYKYCPVYNNNNIGMKINQEINEECDDILNMFNEIMKIC